VAPYTLIPDSISKEVLTALTELLEAAHQGQITGLAFAAVLKGRKFVVDVAGVCYSDPTLTRGVLAALDDELQDLVHGRIDRDTTLR
jgi:hypothetical protein